MPVWRVLTREMGTKGVDVIVASPSAARTRATLEKGRVGVTRVSVHLCPHSAEEPSSEWYNCRTDPRARYEEV